MNKTNISQLHVTECTGCQACSFVCPTKAIKFLRNEEGFLYPKVHSEDCIFCGKCTAVCVGGTKNELTFPSAVFAAVAKDLTLLKDSSSGGIFAVLASKILSDGGSVCGAAMHEDYMLKHIVISDIKDLYRLQGSKYVQSDMSNVYDAVIELLRQNKKVLFCGTPCQVAGIRGAIKGRESDNLFTVDIVCHGVPSPVFFQKHIEAAYGNVSDVRFRHRTKYELNCYALGYYRNGKKYLVQPTDKDSYYGVFSSYAGLRESCYKCPFATSKRVGDITLGDLGTHNLYESFLGDDRALSLVTVNTAKGEELFNACKKTIAFVPADYSAETKVNKQLSAPVQRPAMRSQFYKELFADGYSETVAKKYARKMTVKDFFRNLIIYHVPQKTRKRIKKIINRLRK